MSAEKEINEYLKLMNEHSSVRHFKKHMKIPQEEQNKIIEASQKASSAYNLQPYSIISIEDKSKRLKIAELSGKQQFINDASLFWIFCVDLYKMDYVTKASGFDYYQSQFLESTVISILDTSLVVQSAAIAAESLGYGICMIGGVRNNIDQLIEILNLPKRVFPLVGLCIGYPEKVNPPKNRIPQRGIFFKNQYSKENVEDAINEYDKIMESSGLYNGREFPIDEVVILKKNKIKNYGWIQHSARRVATKNVDKARVNLNEMLNKNGLGLK